MSFDQAGASSGQTRPFTVYCLRSAVSRRTYVGATVDLSRRLRQHNGDLKGGAKYTSSHRPWELAGTVTGFATFREALQFEWRWKKTRVRRSRAIPPLARRQQALEALLRKEPWVSRPLAATFLGETVAPLTLGTRETAVLDASVRNDDATLCSEARHDVPCALGPSQGGRR